MNTKYSVNKLAFGKTIPIKLRFVIDRTKLGQAGVVRKLANILCQRGQNKNQTEEMIKQIRYRNEVRTSQVSEKIARVKSKRVVSYKYQRAEQQMKKLGDEDYSQFFEFNNNQNQSLKHSFKPYHQQEEYKNRKMKEMTIKQPHRKFRRSTELRQKAEFFPGATIWRLDKWQTEQESIISSLLNKS